MTTLNHIQVLRAFSVLAVFVYHLKFDFFYSGYLGVDIFFVISGYLISSKIFYDYQETRKIQLLKFYKSRVKRIMPLLFFFLIISYVFIIFFLPSKYALGTSFYEIISALFGLSNLYFLYRGKTYFDDDLDSPILHTWSLGIEEQFYLIYPLIILFLFKTFNLKKSIFILFIILLVSLFSQIIIDAKNQTKFFFPTFRFWELLAGAVLFFYIKDKKIKNYKLFLSSFILIISIFFVKNENSVILNFLTVMLATIFISTYSSQYLRPIMNNKFLIYIGNISFSFYLWHYLIIFYLNYYFKLSNFVFFIISFVFTFILSSLTYFFIEKKFRYANYYFIQKSFFILPSLILISFLIYTSNIETYWGNHGKKRYLLINKFNYLNIKYDYHERFFFFNKKINENLAYKFCKEGINRSQKLIMTHLKPECLKKKFERNTLYYLEGDSRMAQYLDIFNENSNINFYYKHKSGYKYSYEEVNSLSSSFNKLIYVISINEIEDVENFKKKINKFDDNIEFIIFGPSPNADISNTLLCLIKKQSCLIDTALDKTTRKTKMILNELKNIDSHLIKIIDVYKIICPDNKCAVNRLENNILVFRDKTHLSREGAMLLIKKDIFIN